MIIIGNGPVITRDEIKPYYTNGAVVIEGTEITEVGPFEKVRSKYPESDIIDAKGKVIMPGFINGHTHIYSAFARGLHLKGPVPQNFIETLKSLWWKIDHHLSLEEVYYSALVTYIECIKNGVTTVINHHASYGSVVGSLFEIEKAAQKLHVRTCLAYEISDREGSEKTREAIEENIAFIAYAKAMASDMVKGLIGLHASFTLSDETLAQVRKENVFGAGYHIHIAEGRYDAGFSKERYGKSVVRRLFDEEILGKDTLAGHCIHIDKEDRKLLKETKTTVIHNPESNMNNAVGAPDIIGMLDEGLRVGLGTDGYTNDMLESLKVANILQKHQRGLPNRGFDEACRCLFQHNSEMASKVFECPIGILKQGAKADLIMMDYTPYTPMTAENINGHLMFGMQGAMTDTTIINGQIVMLHRQIMGIDEKELLAACRQQVAAFWKRLD